MKATFKHFPGIGQVVNNTHHFLAELELSVSELNKHDWLPFKQIVENSDAIIMLSHVILTKVDRVNPVSFSYKVVKNIIRDAWQFKGVLISDYLTMGAADSHGLCNSSVNALNAGIDLLLISYNYEKIYDAMFCVNRAFENGALRSDMLVLSQKRLAQGLQFHRSHPTSAH